MKDEEVDLCIEIATEKMQKAIEHLESELSKISAKKGIAKLRSLVAIHFWFKKKVTAQVPYRAYITSPADKVVVGIEGEDLVRDIILKQVDQGWRDFR